MPKHVHISKEELFELYKVQKKTTQQIAEIYNCQRGTIEAKMAIYGITNNRKRYDLDLEHIRKLYVDEDKTSYEIAKILGCRRGSIIRRIKKMGIEIKRHRRKYSKYYEQKLNDEQKEILIGSLLGDGHINHHHDGINSCNYIETHSDKQLPYLMWKFEKFKNFIYRDLHRSDMDNEWGKRTTYSFSTVLHKEFVPFREMFYDLSGRKKVPSNIHLTPLSLAIWFFDDGSGEKCRVVLYTLSFSDEDLNKLIYALQRDLDLNAKTASRKWKYKDGIHYGKVIVFNSEETKKFYKIIYPYLIKSVEYKIPYNPVETCSQKTECAI